jgi:hypothetical protein
MTLADDSEQFDKTYLQEFNQLLSQSEFGRPILPDDWAESNELADVIAALDGISFPFDGSEVAQRMAGHLVSKHIGQCHALGERFTDNRWCPDFDESDVALLSRLYVLVYTYPHYAFPLEHARQYRQAAEALLSHVECCQAEIVRDCQRADSPPTKYVAVRRGDHLCLFKICRTCRQALETLRVDSPDYIGPDRWDDDHDPEPEYDMFRPMNPWTDECSEWEPRHLREEGDNDRWNIRDV